MTPCPPLLDSPVIGLYAKKLLEKGQILHKHSLEKMNSCQIAGGRVFLQKGY